MGKTLTLYIDTVQDTALISADFWQGLAEKELPGENACCADSAAVLKRLSAQVVPETENLLLVVLTRTGHSGEALASLANTLNREIAARWPQLAVFRNLCLISETDTAANIKQLGEILYDLEKQTREREPAADSKPDWDRAPPHRYHVFFCMGPRCMCRGAKSLLMQLRHQLIARNLIETDNENGVLLTRSHCQYPCNQGPLLTVYPDNLWYRVTTPEEVHLFVSEQIEQGRVVPSLLVDQGEH